MSILVQNCYIFLELLSHKFFLVSILEVCLATQQSGLNSPGKFLSLGDVNVIVIEF